MPDFDEEEEKAAAATVKSNQKGVRDRGLNAQDSRNSGGSSDGLTLLYSSDEPTTTSVTTANSASARQLLRLTDSSRYAK